MQLHELHPWDIQPREAIKYQERLLQKISLSPTFNHTSLIAGVDASYQKGFIVGGITILKYPELTLLDREYMIKKGCYSLLFHRGAVIGAVLRTRDKVKPFFISPGNHMNLDKAIEMTISCTTKYRIPEPIRQTHLFVNQIKKSL